jgi:dipeptidyl aminopeptidase/acylaminoacyl peptidase
VYLLDRKNKTEKLITPHSGQAHNDGGGCNRSRPRFSADGRRVYLVSNNDRKLAGFAQIKISANGEAGPLEYLSVRDDAEVVGFAINDAGSATALAWSRSKKNKITIVDLVSGKTSLLPDPPDGSVTEIGISHKGKNIVASILDSLKPWDVWILNDGASSWQQLTHSQHPGLNLDKLIPWELLTFKSADGKVRGGKILRPQSHAPAPYVIALGGGGGSNSSAEHQALVAAGIGVFIPIEAEDIEVVADNYDWHDDSGNWFRSYGNESWQFDKNGLMKHDEGEEAARQLKRLKDCVDYLGSSGIADPKRIGITGSGYETLNAVTEFPDTFAACVERSGWVDFSTFLKNTTPGSAKFFNAEYGSPQSNPKLMDLLSPIKRLDRVKAFVMVQHGALDDTVPVEEAQQVIDYFKKHGKPAESLIVPDEGHTFHKLSNQVKSTVALVLFFVNHLHPDVATN